jgi:hypothetical protein
MLTDDMSLMEAILLMNYLILMFENRFTVQLFILGNCSHFRPIINISVEENKPMRFIRVDSCSSCLYDNFSDI